MSGKVVATYVYKDEQGNDLFRCVRYEPKDFRQQHLDAQGKWQWGLNGVRRVLYRLPELIAADPRRPVFLVEGEKDADRLASLGLVATTAPMGAGKWHADFNETLRGRRVVILPDNDPVDQQTGNCPGRDHALQVERALQGVAASVHVVTLPQLGPKGDVSDWLDAGHTKDELQDVVRQQMGAAKPVQQQQSQSAVAANVDGDPIVAAMHSLSERLLTAAESMEPRDWLLMLKGAAVDFEQTLQDKAA